MMEIFGVRIGLPIPSLPVPPVSHSIDVGQLPERLEGGIEGSG